MFDNDADIPINRDIISSKMTYFEKVVDKIIVDFERGETQPYDPQSRSIWGELADLEDVMSDTQIDRMAKTTLMLATAAKKHAEAGNARAQYTLGKCYLYGYGVDKDPGQAIPWLCKAAEQDDLMAQNAIGSCCMIGEGVEKDPEMAVKWFRMAAEQNLANAQFNLGLCYLYGQGVEKDPEQAIKWFLKAADQNLADAQFNLGLCYLNGQGVEKNAEQAVKWLRMAADQNLARAQNALGACYFNGEGLNKDPEQAVKYFRMAADQNFADAQNNLAYRYLYGEGVQKDAELAVNWLRMAANQDIKEALYGLGLCYDKGDGVPQNTVEAEKWYSKAAKAGHTEAQARLKILKMPVLAYEASKHGPKIKGFFVGMSVKQFDEAAEKILKELGVDAFREVKQDNGMISVYYNDLDSGIWRLSHLSGEFCRDGNLTELFIKRKISQAVFKCEDVNADEFASRFSANYKITFKRDYFMEDDYYRIPIYSYEAITPEGVFVRIRDFNIILSKTATKTELEDAFD